MLSAYVFEKKQYNGGNTDSEELLGWKQYLKEVAVAVEDGGDGSVAQIDFGFNSEVLELHFHSGG